MKNRAKKNNKGFSLVELIVVVLIIGVIAVALAPQVMKWVDTSKKNTDANNENSLKALVQMALTDWQSQGGSLEQTKDAVYTVDTVNTLTPDSSGTDWKIGAAGATLSSVIGNVAGDGYVMPNDTTLKYKITVTKGTGKVAISTVTK
ncbi:MAG: prepilin-type N-terminal cleavage/methylation domain-containing protein [Lachnospiraceae bacterium]|nr:prepilin-type N-terminal cleavage/methylation domain-containing protein [Lachnospiraceae bacterium]